MYLMTVLSSSYVNIMDHALNTPGHGRNVVDGLNATDNHYLKGEMKLMGKLASNDTTNIGILPSASRYVSIKFANQCLHILNNKEVLNGLKGSSKCKIQDHYSNVNNVYTMFKGSLMLMTEVLK